MQAGPLLPQLCIVAVAAEPRPGSLRGMPALPVESGKLLTKVDFVAGHSAS